MNDKIVPFARAHWPLLLALLSWPLAVLLSPRLPFLLLVPPALSLSAALGLGRRRASPGRARWRRWVEPALIVAGFVVATRVVWDHVFRYRLPIDSGDHHVMIMRARILMEGLSHGQIRHWTHLFQGGDTLVDLYPILLNFVTTVVHWVMPRGTPFEMSYSYVVLLAWGLRGVGAYHLARRFAPVLPSLLVAMASCLETGKDVSDGVWNGVFYWGMIHNNIALTVGLFATASHIDAIRHPRRRTLLLCAALYATAACAHPLGLLYGVLSVAAFGLAALGGDLRPQRSLWPLLAAGAGVLAAGFWVLPYTHALRQFGFNGALGGIDHRSLGVGLFEGGEPTSSFGAWMGFALVAITAALTTRRTLLLSVGLLPLFALLLGLSPFMVQSRVFDYFPSFLDGQQRRALTMLKSASVPALAWLLASAYTHLRRHATNEPRALLRRALVLALLVFGPFSSLLSGLGHAVQGLRSQVAQPPDGVRKVRSGDNPDQAAVFAHLRQLRQADPSPTPWRVAVANRYENGAHIHPLWAEGERTGVPVVDFGWMSANFLATRPREWSLQGLRDWNVRYVFSLQATPPLAGMTERFSSGRYHLWEVADYDDHFVTAPAGVTVEGLKLGPDRIEFVVKGAPADGVDVIIRNAYFPRWQIRSGATDLRPTPPHPGARPRQDQLLVHATNGTVVLSCDATMPRALLGWLVTAVGLALALVVASPARRRQIVDRWQAWLPRARVAVADRWATHRARIGAGLAAAVVLAALVVYYRGTSDLMLPPLPGPGMTVAFQPGNKGAARGCWANPLQGLYSCTDSARVDAAEGERPILDDAGEYAYLWPGTRVTWQETGTVELTFPRVNLRRHRLVLKASGRGRIQTEVLVDGRSVWTGALGDGYREQSVPLGPTGGTGRITLRLQGNSGNALVWRGSLP